MLLNQGTNQSYSDKPYEEKINHYVSCNTLVKSLTEVAYQNNPNFTNLVKKHKLPFEPHSEFKKQDIEKRQQLYIELCRIIWDLGPVEA